MNQGFGEKYSASRMVNMLALLFWILFIRLDEVNSKRFFLAPISDLTLLTEPIIASKLLIDCCELDNVSKSGNFSTPDIGSILAMSAAAVVSTSSALGLSSVLP